MEKTFNPTEIEIYQINPDGTKELLYTSTDKTKYFLGVIEQECEDSNQTAVSILNMNINMPRMLSAMESLRENFIDTMRRKLFRGADNANH